MKKMSEFKQQSFIDKTNLDLDFCVLLESRGGAP